MSATADHGAAGSRILIVDDDTAVRLVVRLALERGGCIVDEAENGEEAIAAVNRARPDAVVLDLGLPDAPGLDVLRDIRAMAEIPVLIVTAQASEPERVLGLELGADDYLAKPFSPRELTARVKAVLRRAGGPARSPVRDFGDLVIDLASHEVLLRGELVRLTAKEFDLLRFLSGSPKQVFTKAQLLSHVWNSSTGWQTEATVSEHVHRLRGKIEVNPKRPRRIVTIHGIGYRFDP